MEKKEKLEQRILLISFVAGLLMALSEFIMAFITHSQSVMLDAVYDMVEITVVGITLFMTDLFYRPVSESHPFGYAQVESVIVVAKTVMLITSSAALMANAIQTILSGGIAVDNVSVSAYEAILALISLMVYFFLSRLNRSMTSPTIDLEIRSWKIDTWYSLALCAAFFFGRFIQNTSLSGIYPYLDQIIMLTLSVAFMPSLVSTLIREGRNTFLFPPEEEIVEEIKSRVLDVMDPYPYKITFYDITRTGRQIWVGIYIIPETEMISSRQLKNATESLNKTLGAEYQNCHCELIFDD